MKILAFAASNSRHSINKQLVLHAAEVFRAEIEPRAILTTLDLNDYEMPLYSIDRERADGIPHPAQLFFDQIGRSDAVLIAFAEHNGLYTAAYKNLLDWMSRIDKRLFQGKAMVALATSPGGRGGAGVLSIVQDSVGRFGADLKATLSVPRFAENFDREAGQLSNPDLQTALRSALSTLVSPAPTATESRDLTAQTS